MTAVGRLACTSIHCADPSALADFYVALLGMERAFELGDVVVLSDGAAMLTMMKADEVVAGHQQLHLDVAVTDLEPAVAAAEALGATQAEQQAGPEVWRVMHDPQGHVFCLTTAVPQP